MSPNQPKTPTRTIRIEEGLWQAAKEKAAGRGETVTKVVVRALEKYLEDGRSDG